MDELEEPDNNVNISKIHGVPKSNINPGEPSLWIKFWSATFPWLNRKYLQLERLVEVEIAIKEAEKDKIIAERKRIESNKMREDAEVILLIQKVKEKELELYERYSKTTETEDLTQNLKEEIEETLHLLKLLKGTSLIAKYDEQHYDSDNNTNR